MLHALHTALEQRSTAWRRCHVRSRATSRKRSLKDIRADSRSTPPSTATCLQDVLGPAGQDVSGVLPAGGDRRAAWLSRYQRRTRWHSFTFKEYGNGARLDRPATGAVEDRAHRRALVSRPVEGSIKTVTVSKEADGGTSASAVRTCLLSRCRSSARTGIDVGLEVFLSTADGRSSRPAPLPQGRARVAEGAAAGVPPHEGGQRRRAAHQCAKQHQHVRRQRSDFHHKTALALVRPSTT